MAWATPELLELEEEELLEELEDEELEVVELEEEDEEPGGFDPPQPATLNNDTQQILANAHLVVNTLFILTLSILLFMLISCIHPLS